MAVPLETQPVPCLPLTSTHLSPGLLSPYHKTAVRGKDYSLKKKKALMASLFAAWHS